MTLGQTPEAPKVQRTTFEDLSQVITNHYATNDLKSGDRVAYALQHLSQALEDREPRVSGSKSNPRSTASAGIGLSRTLSSVWGWNNPGSAATGSKRS